MILSFVPENTPSEVFSEFRASLLSTEVNIEIVGTGGYPLNREGVDECLTRIAYSGQKVSSVMFVCPRHETKEEEFFDFESLRSSLDEITLLIDSLIYLSKLGALSAECNLYFLSEVERNDSIKMNAAYMENQFPCVVGTSALKLIRDNLLSMSRFKVARVEIDSQGSPENTSMKIDRLIKALKNDDLKSDKEFRSSGKRQPNFVPTQD